MHDDGNQEPPDAGPADPQAITHSPRPSSLARPTTRRRHNTLDSPRADPTGRGLRAARIIDCASQSKDWAIRSRIVCGQRQGPPPIRSRDDRLRRAPGQPRRTPRAAARRGSSSGAADPLDRDLRPGRAFDQPVDLRLPRREVGRHVGPRREDPELAHLLGGDAAGGEVGDQAGGEAQPRVGDVHPRGQDRARRRRRPGPPPSRRGPGRCRGRGS